MSKPVKNVDYDKITLRLPRHLHESFRELADHKATSVNAEILAVLMQKTLVERVESMAQVTDEMKAMVKQILDTVRPEG